ncbi:MAG: DUF169 domain-containing protein [Deltaproteobacteria bacterium]|nr:DUF169 domain-containing protein [Deltaproteobacteria bacterium]
MQPDPSRLLEKLGITIPLIGLYDAPDAGPFEPLVQPEPRKHTCVFAFYQDWLKGKTLHITDRNYGCAGGGRWLCGASSRAEEDLITFLVDGEGLKASRELMERWIDYRKPHHPEHGHVCIGPLRESQFEYLKSITFFITPDQLGALSLGANYDSAPGEIPPVIVPFGSGCSQLVGLFEDLDAPQAVIGATDIAMRQHIPPDILAFTVTKAMFRRLCELDERSFLYKPFWKNLRKTRERSE